MLQNNIHPCRLPESFIWLVLRAVLDRRALWNELLPQLLTFDIISKELTLIKKKRSCSGSLLINYCLQDLFFWKAFEETDKKGRKKIQFLNAIQWHSYFYTDLWSSVSGGQSLPAQMWLQQAGSRTSSPPTKKYHHYNIEKWEWGSVSFTYTVLDGLDTSWNRFWINIFF